MFEYVAGAFLVGLVLGSAVSTSSDDSPDSVKALLEDRRESVQEDYSVGLISHERLADELTLLEDPETERVMYAVADVDGVGPKKALAVARQFRSLEELSAADADDLEEVNGVGENYARAICERSYT
jgi:NAD-dependent DNA ligase